MIKSSKKFFLSVGGLLVAIILGFSAYTVGVYVKSKPLEQIKGNFAAGSITQATHFVQSDALPFGTSGESNYLTYAAVGEADNVAEMFLIHNQPFLRVTGFPRFVSDAHYTADEPVGFASTILADVNGKDAPTGFLYSSNKLEIVRIDCQFRDRKNGLVQEESIGVSLEPFARAFSLKSENMELEAMVCYDFSGNVVYSAGQL